MEKLQNDLARLFAQYEYVQKAMKFDLILLFIYPIYRLLCLLPLDFIYKFHKFSTLFLLLFIVGAIFSFANNKLKELVLAVGVLAILSVVDVFLGGFDGIVYAIIYGFITYQVYKFMNNTDSGRVDNRRKCPKCGKAVGNDEVFCTSCGEKLK